MYTINLQVHFPNIFLGVKAILMALCCFEATVTHSMVTRIICVIAYIALVHMDIIAYIQDDTNDDEYKEI